MSLRPSVIALGLVAVLSLVACTSGAQSVPEAIGPSSGSTNDPGALPTDNSGNIGTTFPELTLERNVDGTLHVSVTDPTAKAWRITVAGEGPHAQDRLEIIVATGDVQPSVVVRETVGGSVVDEVELTGLDGAPTAVAGGCHHTLPVCYNSAALTLPGAGDPTVAVDLELLDPAAALVITGGSADWPGEPFELGPWRESDPFTTAE